jgi:hypothetical protein
VSVERVFELVRHLTERDRELAARLYDQQVLTTDQLTLLYFSSKRRAQDRLLFLYRERVLDRFYPPSRFGAGKPQAHWLLDEVGAVVVAAMLGVERKQLGWQRREDCWRFGANSSKTCGPTSPPPAPPAGSAAACTTCVRPASMAQCQTPKPRRDHGTDAGLHLHAHLDGRGEPADVAPLAAGTAGGVLQSTGGLADRRP